MSWQGKDDETHTAYVTIRDNIDASRVIGKGGKNRARIEKAIGCSIRKSKDDTYFEICGKYENAKTVETIIKCIMVRSGDVPLKSREVQNCCTVLQIPRQTVKMVLGKRADHLHSIEDEAETVMFLGKIVDQERTSDTSTVIIFGARYGRRLSQLLIMGLVESIVEGTFTKPWQQEWQSFDTESDLDGDWGTTVREISDDAEMSYIIGRNASTRTKLMKTSGCIIARVGLLMFISGSKQQRTSAGEQMDLILDGRDREVGYVGISKPEERKDCTLITIPDEYVAWVTGIQRQTLNRLEQTWGVMVQVLTERPSPDEQTFAIFGPDRARCGAHFRLQDLMEKQCPGFITSKILDRRSLDESFAVDYLQLEYGEAAYVCGTGGYTEQKLAAASNAVIHFIGSVCCIGGDFHERKRAHDYIEWLVLVSNGETLVLDACDREDVTEIALSNEEDSFLTSPKLQEIGQETDTVLFFARTSAGEHYLLICGHDAGKSRSKAGDTGRARAELLVSRFLASQGGPANVGSPSNAQDNSRQSHKRKEVWNDWNTHGSEHKKQHIEGSRPHAIDTSDSKSQSGGPWRIFVAGLPSECTDEQFRALVEQICSASDLAVEDIVNCTVKPGKRCGWVELSSQSAGDLAIEELHQREVRGWEEPLRARWTLSTVSQHEADRSPQKTRSQDAKAKEQLAHGRKQSRAVIINGRAHEQAHKHTQPKDYGQKQSSHTQARSWEGAIGTSNTYGKGKGKERTR